MHKVAVLGDYDSIYGFATVGFSIFPASSREEAKAKFRELTSGAYGIIYVTEKLAAELYEEIEECRDKVAPAVILIPGVSGNTGVGLEGVKKTVEQAVGADILFAEEER